MDVENPCQNYIVVDQRRNRGPPLPPVNTVDMARRDFIEKEGTNMFHGVRRDLRPDKCVGQPPELRVDPPNDRHQQQCINPQYPTVVCDDLLSGRIRDSNADSYNDRCKVSDPLHVRYKRFCAPLGPQSTRQCAVNCCGQLGAEPCVGFLCTPTGWLDKDNDYFRYAGLKKPPVKCQYPLPCKAHCYETHPRQNTWDPARQNAQCSPRVQPRTSTAQRDHPTSEKYCVQPRCHQPVCVQPTVKTTVPGEEHKQYGDYHPSTAIHAIRPPGEAPKQQEHGYKQPVKQDHDISQRILQPTPAIQQVEQEKLAQDPQSTQQGHEIPPVKFIRTHMTPPDLGAPTSTSLTLSEKQNYPGDPRTHQLQPHQYKYTIKRPMDGGSEEAMGGQRQHSMRMQYPEH